MTQDLRNRAALRRSPLRAILRAMTQRNSIYPVAAFTVTYLAVATLFAFRYQNWEFVFYIIVVLLLALFVAMLHRRVDLSRGALWALALWGLLHMTGGLVPTPEGWPINGDKNVFYSLWIIPNYLKYDQLIHAYGFGVGTWVSWQTLHALLPKSVPTAGILVICVLAGMGLGAMNEVIEFVATLIIPNTNVGGYVNTGWDLISNMVGSITSALIIWNLHPSRRDMTKLQFKKFVNDARRRKS